MKIYTLLSYNMDGDSFNIKNKSELKTLLNQLNII